MRHGLGNFLMLKDTPIKSKSGYIFTSGHLLPDQHFLDKNEANFDGERRGIWLKTLESRCILICFFMGPESDHWQCSSVTHSLTDCSLVNLIDVTLACEDAYSILVEVFTVAGVDDEDSVSSLLQICRVRKTPSARQQC